MDRLPVEIGNAECLALGTDQITVLATAEQTGGALFAALVRMPPGGGPPVMHMHEPGEVYHVLEGEFAFYVGPPDGVVARVVVAAGQVMPPGGQHSAHDSQRV